MSMPLIRADWRAPPGVQALCVLKPAGNTGSTDPAENDRLVQLAGLPGVPRWLTQVHGTRVVDLDAQEGSARPEADASVTSRSGIVCAVLSADCLPVLLAAADGSVLGAAHAGWRGLCAGVIESTAAAMRGKLARDMPIRAWLGPAIGPAHFEVGEEVRAAFLQKDREAGSAFVAGSGGRWLCDLYALARQRLSRLGMDEVSGGTHCTYSDPSRFHSHRRDVTHGGGTTGRMATLIWRVDPGASL